MRSFLYKMPGAEPESTWTPDDWAAVNEHSRQTGAAVMRVVLLISATVNVLLWYLEWSGQAIRVPAALHIGLLALTLGVLYGPGAELLRRWPTAVGLLVLVPTVAALGAWLGADAGPRSFAWLYLLGTTTVVFVVRIVPRIGITALLMGVAVLGYVLAAGPDVWQSPQLPTQLSFLAFVIVISTGNGHYTFWVSSGAALQRVRMAERQGELAKLHAQLEGRVSGQKAELGALAEHLRPVRDRERLTLRPEIRAELAPDGGLVDDFVINDTGTMIHVINAPSPAATVSSGKSAPAAWLPFSSHTIRNTIGQLLSRSCTQSCPPSWDRSGFSAKSRLPQT